jgi:dTDP-glucose pyrophosphorylase
VKNDEINKSDIKDNFDGFIPAFLAYDDKWLFIKLDGERVIEIKEKVKISDNATVGFYYFKSWKNYKIIFNKYKEEIKKNFKELYIAPMYQYLINEGKYIVGKIIEGDHIVALGTPEDIEKII